MARETTGTQHRIKRPISTRRIIIAIAIPIAIGIIIGITISINGVEPKIDRTASCDHPVRSAPLHDDEVVARHADAVAPAHDNVTVHQARAHAMSYSENRAHAEYHADNGAGVSHLRHGYCVACNADRVVGAAVNLFAAQAGRHAGVVPATASAVHA